MIHQTKTAFKAIVIIALFASFFATGCNNAKDESKEPAKTEEAAPAPAPPVTDTTKKDTTDTPKPGPVTPVN